MLSSFFDCSSSQESLRIIDRLHNAGFVAYLAGGCVRDALLGRPPKDYDVATDATPTAVRELFGKSRTLAFGASFGVIGVLPEREGRADAAAAIEPTEVATFRSDGTYSDGRRPDAVHFGDAEQDALRRDFTINGLFYDPASDRVIDFVDGRSDLRDKILRTIGDPELRFGEDKLRMLRAVRFATTLGFKINPPTLQAIRLHADDIAPVSGERIGAEMRRILASPHVVQGLGHLQQSGLHRQVFPELITADAADWTRLLGPPSDRSFQVVLALLMLALTSPLKALRQLTQRWKLSNEEVRQATSGWKHWRSIADADHLPWSTVQPILVNRDAQLILAVAEAVVQAEGLPSAGIERARRAITWPAEQLDPPPLLDGNDLRELQIRPGPQFKPILQTIRNQASRRRPS